MSKRMATVRKMVLLLGLGGAFAFPLVSGGDLSCVRNQNLVDFYQGVGGAVIDSLQADAAAGASTTMNNLVITPSATLWRAAFDNWVAQQFPLDLDVTGVVQQ